MDGTNDERQRIRERKKRELRQRLENDDGSTATDASDGTRSPSEPIAITDRDHLDRIVAEHSVVLVDCYADWCGPCQMLEPTIEALAAESAAAVAKVDVDALPGLAQRLGVRGVPTLLVYAQGELVERTSGVQDRATLESLINRHR